MSRSPRITALAEMVTLLVPFFQSLKMSVQVAVDGVMMLRPRSP